MSTKNQVKLRPVPFKDKEGKVRLMLPNTMTIKELAVCGISLRMVPKSEPMQPDELRTDLVEYFGKKEKGEPSE